MSTRHSDHDGSDIFWPGYVDAISNLVLNLLFLLTIMTVAVFMFALELGRASKVVPSQPPVASVKPDPGAVAKATFDPARENIELKLEIQRLNAQLAERVSQQGQPAQILKPLKPVPPAQPMQLEQPSQPGGLVKTVDVTSNVPRPLHGLDAALADDSEIIVRFMDEAVAFTPAERDLLLESLKPIVANGKARISVDVPAGFSEPKRMGFYRAMAVRNLLIEMKMPKGNIEVSVLERKNNANASTVRVK